ncbi:MAG TPA: response regulator [Tepidisphaeraceae bacterium]|nr:response regulator [Tepidisphaeraceae bacterium]
MQNQRILIVDDNRAIHMDFKRILAASPTADLDRAAADLFGDSPADRVQTSYELSFCSQGGEAIEAVESANAAGKPFAIAFVDMRMPPGIDGVETVFRMWKADPKLQAVICTAYSDRSWEQIIDRLGQTDQLLVLKKPFDPAEVSQIASSLTRKWNLHRQTELQMAEMSRLVASRAGELKILNSAAFTPDGESHPERRRKLEQNAA